MPHRAGEFNGANVTAASAGQGQLLAGHIVSDSTERLISALLSLVPTGAFRLPLVGGPHDGAHFPCSLAETEPGQWVHLPGLPPNPSFVPAGPPAPELNLPLGVHPADVPGHPAYPPSVFYLVTECDGELVAEHVPGFNPYSGEADTRGL